MLRQRPAALGARSECSRMQVVVLIRRPRQRDAWIAHLGSSVWDGRACPIRRGSVLRRSSHVDAQHMGIRYQDVCHREHMAEANGVIRAPSKRTPHPSDKKPAHPLVWYWRSHHMVDLVKCVDSKTRSCGVAFARGMMGRAYLASGGVWSSEKKETCTALMCKLCRRLTIQVTAVR